jgi:hypothetical protein
MVCIDPLNTDQNRDSVVNVVTGEVADKSVNVYNSVKIGTAQMKDFEGKLPEGFYDTITKKIVTMSTSKKHVKVGQEKVFDTSLIYSRVLGLQASGRTVDIHHVLSHELAPVPTALFDDNGELRIPKSKASLKRQLQIEVTDRKVCTIDTQIIDGSALLWVIPYPAEGLVKDYISNFKVQMAYRLEKYNVYIVFDRYRDYSTKSTTRSARANGASRVFQLHKDSKLPAQKVLLSVSENKKQLIDMIITEILEDDIFMDRNTQHHVLVMTGEEETPLQIKKGQVQERRDIKTMHEEADVILIQQVLACTRKDITASKNISVVCDDTDVFVLLLYYYWTCGLADVLIMESPIRGKSVIDIAKTVQKHEDIVEGLLAAHALTGCDTVASCFGIGKGTAIKVLRQGKPLTLLGVLDSPIDDVAAQATVFMAACYGHENTTGSMSDTRVYVWGMKLGKSVTSKLCCLPPTSESFIENVKRAHYQAFIWRSLLEETDQSVLEPTGFGWKKNLQKRALLPVMLPDKVEVAPSFILKLIKCGCQSTIPCNTRMCNCKSANMYCTIFCSCYSVGCNNK